MTVDTGTRPGRMQTGNDAEIKCIAFLLWNGISVYKIGQENWLPDWIHAKIRYNYDRDVELLKHIPDLDTGRALIQVKDAPRESGYSHVTLEKASYQASLRWCELGIPVLMAWRFQDGKTYQCQWVDKISPIEPETDREELNGSKTPMYKIAKNELEPLQSFLGFLRNGQ